MAWCTSRPHDDLDKVEGVVLDISKAYFSVVQEVFGDHVHVVDRFHGVQQAVGALEAVLRSVQKQRDPEEAKERKKLRPRWLQSADQLNVDALSARDEWRQRLPP